MEMELIFFVSLTGMHSHLMQYIIPKGGPRSACHVDPSSRICLPKVHSATDENTKVSDEDQNSTLINSTFVTLKSNPIKIYVIYLNPGNQYSPPLSHRHFEFPFHALLVQNDYFIINFLIKFFRIRFLFMYSNISILL